MLTGVGFGIRQWQEVKVGDIVRVKKDQYFPCDLVVLDHNK